MKEKWEKSMLEILKLLECSMDKCKKRNRVI